MEKGAQDLREKASKLMRGVKGLTERAKHSATASASWAQEVGGGKFPGMRRTSGPFNKRKDAASSSHDTMQSQKVELLCDLGFSPSLARQALLVNGGRVEDAGEWLLDRRTIADEELSNAGLSSQASLLHVGCAAHVGGLRSAAHLNGTLVRLIDFDKESQRWTVQLPDGSAKAMRPRNLEYVQRGAPVASSPSPSPSPGRPFAPAARGTPLSSASETSASSTAAVIGTPAKGAGSVLPASGLASSAPVAASIGITPQDLRRRLTEILGDSSPETMETLQALSGEELMEAIAGLADEGSPAQRAIPQASDFNATPGNRGGASAAACTPGGADPAAASSSDAPPVQKDAASAPSRAAVAAAAEGTEEAAHCERSSELVALEARVLETREREEEQRLRAEALERRERELLEERRRWQQEAESKTEHIRCLQVQFEEMRAAQAQQTTQRDCEVTPEQQDGKVPVAGEAPSAVGALADEERERRRSEEGGGLGEASTIAESWSSRAFEEEAERLRAEREALEQLKAQTERTAQELDQRAAGARAKAEERELRMLEQEAQQMRLGSALAEEQSRIDHQRRSVLLLQKSLCAELAQPEGPCVELTLDDTDVVEEEDATPLLQQKGSVFAVQSPTKEPRVTAEKVEARQRAALQAATAEMASVEVEGSDEDGDDEVWDLDWNALALKGIAFSPQSDLSGLSSGATPGQSPPPVAAASTAEAIAAAVASGEEKGES